MGARGEEREKMRRGSVRWRKWAGWREEAQMKSGDSLPLINKQKTELKGMEKEI